MCGEALRRGLGLKCVCSVNSRLRECELSARARGVAMHTCLMIASFWALLAPAGMGPARFACIATLSGNADACGTPAAVGRGACA